MGSACGVSLRSGSSQALKSALEAAHRATSAAQAPRARSPSAPQLLHQARRSPPGDTSPLSLDGPSRRYGSPPGPGSGSPTPRSKDSPTSSTAGGSHSGSERPLATPYQDRKLRVSTMLPYGRLP